MARIPNTIGYVSIGELNDTVKAVKIEGIDATEANVLAETYKISRPFIYISNGTMTSATKAYLEFVLSDEGQAIVGQHYISVQKEPL